MASTGVPITPLPTSESEAEGMKETVSEVAAWAFILGIVLTVWGLFVELAGVWP